MPSNKNYMAHAIKNFDIKLTNRDGETVRCKLFEYFYGGFCEKEKTTNNIILVVLFLKLTTV